MKRLPTASSIAKELRRLVRRKNVRFDWAVAWASPNSMVASLLHKHREQIDRLTVGLHFYQTAPDFIDRFREQRGVRFMLDTRGVFHPKVYLFTFPDGRWQCIVGSANLTAGGMRNNREVAVLITSDDDGADEALAEVTAQLGLFEAATHEMTAAAAAAYRTMHEAHAPARRLLAGQFGQPRKTSALDDGGISAVNSCVLRMTWDDYLERVRQDEEHDCEGRLAVLQEVRRHFESCDSFQDLSLVQRQQVAGVAKHEGGPRWRWFGSMTGSGVFKHAVNENAAGLAAAIDIVPLTGPVTREHYEEYRAAFSAAFEGGRGSGDGAIATATRLLAMKRPDYFVCLDSKNRRALCRSFGVLMSLKLDRYWDSLCERIQQAAWWLEPEPADPEDARIWRGNAAAPLDALFYEPNAKRDD